MTVTAVMCLRSFQTSIRANEAGSLHQIARSAIRNVGLTACRCCYDVNEVVGGFYEVKNSALCGDRVGRSVTLYQRPNFRWISMKVRLAFFHNTVPSKRECGDVM